jgi:hypothetical protein
LAGAGVPGGIRGIERLLDVRDGGDGLADDFESIQIKTHDHKRPSPEEGEMAGCGISSICGIFKQYTPFSGTGFQHGNTGLLVPGMSHNGKQNSLPAGQTKGKPVGEFPF